MIKVGKKTIPLDFSWSTSPKGRLFRLSSIKKGKKEVYNRFDWFYIFKYKEGDYFTIHLNVNGDFIKKLNNEDTIKLLNDEQ
jgi:CRISPR/Cas system CMR-associated protein Cmr1 (group 7 of RAMP superfamily)